MHSSPCSATVAIHKNVNLNVRYWEHLTDFSELPAARAVDLCAGENSVRQGRNASHELMFFGLVAVIV